MFNELGGGSGKGLDPEKISSVGVDTLKKVKARLEALFTLVRFGRFVYVFAILAAAILLSGALVSTVKKGTYQIRQMIITGTMRAKLDPGMWPRLLSDIVTWPKAQTFFFTKDVEGGRQGGQQHRGSVQ